MVVLKNAIRYFLAFAVLLCASQTALAAIEQADPSQLGDVTSVKNFRLGFDQQLLVQGFPLNKAIYVQIKIRDFIALCALKSQTDKVSPRISHFSNSSFYF